MSNIKKGYKKNVQKIIIGILLFIIVELAVIGTSVVSKRINIPEAQRIHQDAVKAYNGCLKTITTKERCYTNFFYALTKKHNFTYSISALKVLNTIDVQSRGCHLIAHMIAIAETEKNPDRWKDLISKMDINMCSGGLVHGVLEAHTRYDNNFTLNSKTIDEICTFVEGNFGKQGEYNCSHIMGHLALSQELGNFQKALDFCNGITPQRKYECYSGVFMENETRDNLVIHDGFIKVKWDDDFIKVQEGICSQYSDEQANACWREISHLYVARYQDDPFKVFKACSRAPTKKATEDCYVHASTIIVVSIYTSKDDLISVCAPLESHPGAKDQCLSSVIGALLTSSSAFVDRAKIFCNSLGSDDVASCYSKIGRNLSMLATPEEHRQLCSTVPKEYYINCIDKRAIN